MALPADFSKIYGETATGGLTPISDVNYSKGWEYVGSNPPTKNDFSYLQNFSDLKAQWLYNNKLQRSDPFGDIKSDGTVSQALSNLGLGTAAKKDVGTGTGQIPDMSSFVFTGEDLGSYRLPGGMIIQWAHLTSLDSTGWTLVNFQNAWPTKILGAIAINEAGTVLADKIMGVKRLTDTQLQITAIVRSDGTPGQGGAYVLAWGK